MPSSDDHRGIIHGRMRNFPLPDQTAVIFNHD